jgi:hypothetical protein
LLVSSWLTACALATFAICPGSYLYLFFAAENCLSESYAKIIKEISPWLRCRPTSSPASSKTEEVLKNVTKSGKYILEPTKSGESSSLEALVAELVVDITFFWIPQNLVGLSCLFELFFSFLIPRVSVRMVIKRQFAVSFFYLFIRGIPVYTKNLIVIPLYHHCVFLMIEYIPTKGASLPPY